MLRCILTASVLTASALHSPSLQEVDASEEVAGDDTALEVAAEDQEEIENEHDKDLDVDESADSFAEVAGDVDVDDEADLGDDDDDDEDDLDLDDINDDVLDDDDDDDLDLDLDDDLDSLVEESGEAGEDNGGDDDDEDDEDESDDVEDDEDNEDDEDDDDDEGDEDDAEEKAPTMINEADDEQAESSGFEFAADVPLEHGPTDQASVFAKAKAAGKPAMVLASKSWCPHCKDLVESMNADPAIKALLSKFVAFHAPDSQGEAWHGDIGYVPRVFFYNKDGQQIDVHSPYAQYPYFFDSSKVLQDGMQTALSQA